MILQQTMQVGAADSLVALGNRRTRLPMRRVNGVSILTTRRRARGVGVIERTDGHVNEVIS
ncbi:hypothetical protein BKA25_003515 [Actinoalloteichus hymeniacidonis]|uniref:Uncharacterized protein n=1 Tax=Actinoalloteichus hymeniacidonis TaxID=340345 RepID=A0AAC9HNY0_9PSEU|nr:hypothetical protein TL08_09775 [Actinoalloteichus hymeniacidonis]MBB5909199.1 hypothetical protein [Actinoalloteichus hymeniacidonis]